MSKFLNKYRVESHRHPTWNYDSNGLYFLTIVTQGRIHNLGKVIQLESNNYKTMLSDYGKIVEAEFYKSFEIRKELHLDEFIIMPNHIHAIVAIANNIPSIPNGYNLEIESKNNLNESDDLDDRNGLDDHLQMHGRASLQPPSSPPSSQFPDYIKRNPPIRLPKSISSFIAGFKSSVNTQIDNYIDNNGLKIRKYNKDNHFFQPNYHDHIIRNDKEYYNIKNYIIDNPLNWGKDKIGK
jgi:putative transposase